MVVREVPSTQPWAAGSDASTPGGAADFDLRTPSALAPDEAVGLDSVELREFAGSTPARLTVMGVILLLLTLASGIVTVATVHSRSSTLQTLLSATEPLANSAQNLYSALSIADAAATTAFISRGLEPREVRERYLNAVTTASTELVYATAGLNPSDAENARLLAEISSSLTTYTGLVETARANNRVGNPVGSAYLGEASTLMQGTVLPMAQELHANQERRVASTQESFSQPPWLTIILLLVTVAMLVAAQVAMTKHSRRTFNPGLIVASGAMALLLGWLMIAGLLSAMGTSHALSQGGMPLHVLTDARITAQQVRAEETLKLVRREGDSTFDAAYREKSAHLTELLTSYPPGDDVSVARDDVVRAHGAWVQWQDAHSRMDSLLAAGDHSGAAAIAVGVTPTDAPSRFQEVDGALTEGIVHARNTLRENITAASKVLGGLVEGAVVLTVIAAAAIVAGVRPRLREYR